MIFWSGTPEKAIAQYRGGTQQGFDINAPLFPQNLMPLISFGGVQDGIDVFTSTSQNVSPAIHFGGSNDGFAVLSTPNQNQSPMMFYGGTADGFQTSLVANSNTLPEIYSGGTSDGFHLEENPGTNLSTNIYFGGSEDGFDVSSSENQNSPCSGDLFVWTGLISDDWHEPGNWECRVLPGLFSNVLIPEGLIEHGNFYPIVFSAAEVSTIKMSSGSYLQIRPGVILKLKGE